MVRPAVFLAVASVVVCILAGCGESGQVALRSSSGVSSQTGTQSVTLAVRDVDPIGQILVDGTGRTVYAFEADRPGVATCEDACADMWPPYRVSATPRPGDSGVTNAAMLGTVGRADGTRQVTYAGHPMYYFVGDDGPGVANGQGRQEFGSRWFVVALDGTLIERR